MCSRLNAVYMSKCGNVYHVTGRDRPAVERIGFVVDNGTFDGEFRARAFPMGCFDRATIAAMFASDRRVRRALAREYLTAHAKACEDTHPRPLPRWAQ